MIVGKLAFCFLVVFLIAITDAQNITCLSGSYPFPLNTNCTPGYYCPFLPLPPTFCSPTIECSLLRIGSGACEPQGTTEPTICPKGYYCETPLTKQKCPQGYFCKTGTFSPEKCPPISVCPEGSFRPRYMGSLIICIIIDLFLLAIYLFIKFSSRPPSRVFSCLQSSSSSLSPPSLSVEMQQKRGSQQDVVVAKELVEGFKNARENEDVSLLFEFDNLSVTLPSGLNILQGVSGSVRPGRVTAIMGPSGAGKTTFMGCLMGKIPRTGGSLKINHKDLEIHTLRKVIGYVPQDDVMLSELTVKENIAHSAKIRLPKKWTSTEINEFTKSVLDALDLSHVADTVVGDHTRRGISGGQRKRTNIGIELASAPLAIFLDEPTSGLDSTAALKVAEILRDMAQLGITVVAVIHQPRHEIFALFDDILMIAPGGCTAFLGPQSDAVDHFKKLGFIFDPYINQADQLMDILSGKGTKNNAESYTVQEIIDSWNEHEARNKEDNQATLASSSGESEFNSKSLETIQKLGKERGSNFVIQTLLCHNRSIIQQYRLIPALVLEIAVSMLAGALMGLATGNGSYELYRGIFVAPYTILSPAPVEWAVPLYSLLFGMAIGLAGGPAGVKTFGEERMVFFREAASGHGHLSYFLGKSISVMYRQVLSALHFAMIYHIMAAPLTSFASIFSVVFLFFFCVYGLAAVVSMLVRRENASLLGVVTCLFAAVFNGFGPNLDDARSWGLGWLWDMSYARWLSEAMYTEEVLPYAHVYEVYKVSEPQYGFTLGRFAQDCGIAFAIGIVLRAAAFILLLVTKRKQQK